MTPLDVIRNKRLKCLNIDSYEYDFMKLKKVYLSFPQFVNNSL